MSYNAIFFSFAWLLVDSQEGSEFAVNMTITFIWEEYWKFVFPVDLVYNFMSLQVPLKSLTHFVVTTYSSVEYNYST